MRTIHTVCNLSVNYDLPFWNAIKESHLEWVDREFTEEGFSNKKRGVKYLSIVVIEFGWEKFDGQVFNEYRWEGLLPADLYMQLAYHRDHREHRDKTIVAQGSKIRGKYPILRYNRSSQCYLTIDEADGFRPWPRWYNFLAVLPDSK